MDFQLGRQTGIVSSAGTDRPVSITNGEVISVCRVKEQDAASLWTSVPICEVGGGD